MSIDRIGKGGGGLPPGGISPDGPSSTSQVGSTPAEFAATKATPAEAVAKPPLDQLRAGEISISKYLDVKVNEATAHLDQRLSAEQLSFIRDNLRQQLSTDPVLVDMVKSTTGVLPPQQDE